MPRKSREKSETKDYHTMLRGIDKQDIFFDIEDKFRFEAGMREAKERYHFSLYSYVLMPNHIHMELKDDEEKLDKIMKYIAQSYASYFNRKYDRIGTLFQGRYRSKPVEDEEYLMNLMRYIHQNPQKAGISTLSRYRWSSYGAYLKKENELVDVDLLLEKFGEDRIAAVEEFKQFHQQDREIKTSEEILNYEITTHLMDDELILLLKKELKITNVLEIQSYNAKIRNQLIRKVSEIKGTNIEQIARVLGMNRKIIGRAISKSKGKEN